LPGRALGPEYNPQNYKKKNKKKINNKTNKQKHFISYNAISICQNAMYIPDNCYNISPSKLNMQHKYVTGCDKVFDHLG
jgi:hypothetical protein